MTTNSQSSTSNRRNATPPPPPRPVPLSHYIESARPSRFLKWWHLANNGMDEITDVIDRLLFEPVTQDGQTYEEVLVIYFRRIKTPFLLTSKANLDILQKSYRCATFADLIGLEITLVIAQHNNKSTLRIKPLAKDTRPKRVGQQPAPNGQNAPPAPDADAEPTWCQRCQERPANLDNLCDVCRQLTPEDTTGDEQITTLEPAAA